MIDREVYLYNIAKLIDHFHLTIPEIGKLTDRQLGQLYFHARDEQGALETAPIRVGRKKPDTLEGELLELERMAAAFRIPVDKVEELRQALKDRYALKGASGGSA